MFLLFSVLLLNNIGTFGTLANFIVSYDMWADCNIDPCPPPHLSLLFKYLLNYPFLHSNSGLRSKASQLPTQYK